MPRLGIGIGSKKGSVSGSIVFPLEAALPASAGVFNFEDRTSMFVERDGTGGNPSIGTGRVGVWLNKKAMQNGESAAAYMARNSITDPLLVPGPHGIAAADDKRPTLTATGVNFDGANDCLAFATNPLAGASSGYGVVRAALTVSPTVSPGIGAPLAWFGTSASQDVGPWINGHYIVGWGSSRRPDHGDISSHGTNAIRIEHESVTDAHKVYVEGAQIGSTETGNVEWGTAPGIAAGASSTVFYAGTVGNIVLIDSVPTGDDLANVRAFVDG